MRSATPRHLAMHLYFSLLDMVLVQDTAPKSGPTITDQEVRLQCQSTRMIISATFHLVKLRDGLAVIENHVSLLLIIRKGE